VIRIKCVIDDCDDEETEIADAATVADCHLSTSCDRGAFFASPLIIERRLLSELSELGLGCGIVTPVTPVLVVKLHHNANLLYSICRHILMVLPPANRWEILRQLVTF